MSLPGDTYRIVIEFYHNQTLPPLLASFSSALRTPAPITRQDAVCTVQTYQNEVSGVKLLSWSLYYLSLSYSVIIYDRYAMHASYITPFLDSPRFQSRLVYIPYTVFEIWNPSYYNSFQRLRQVCCDLTDLDDFRGLPIVFTRATKCVTA